MYRTIRTETAFIFMDTMAVFKSAEHAFKMVCFFQTFHQIHYILRHIFYLAAGSV